MCEWIQFKLETAQAQMRSQASRAHGVHAIKRDSLSHSAAKRDEIVKMASMPDILGQPQ